MTDFLGLIKLILCKNVKHLLIIFIKVWSRVHRCVMETGTSYCVTINVETITLVT